MNPYNSNPLSVETSIRMPQSDQGTQKSPQILPPINSIHLNSPNQQSSFPYPNQENAWISDETQEKAYMFTPPPPNNSNRQFLQTPQLLFDNSSPWYPRNHERQFPTRNAARTYSRSSSSSPFSAECPHDIDHFSAGNFFSRSSPSSNLRARRVSDQSLLDVQQEGVGKKRGRPKKTDLHEEDAELLRKRNYARVYKKLKDEESATAKELLAYFRTHHVFKQILATSSQEIKNKLNRYDFLCSVKPTDYGKLEDEK